MAAASECYLTKPVGSECHLIQTREIRAPCYIHLSASPQEKAPPFVFYELLPKSVPGMACALLQTLDSRQACFTRPRPLNARGDSPAFFLQVPLPKGADQYDLNLAAGNL